MLSPTFDLAQHPTNDTIRLLASLLERMTTANDQLNKSTFMRKGASEMLPSSSVSPLGSCSHSSPVPTSSSTATTTAAAATNITNDINNSTVNSGNNSSNNSSSSTGNNNKSGNSNNKTYTLFHARSIPSIDIHSYLSRILKYCPCANECFLSLLVYFDRMSKNALTITGQPFTIDSYNIHRLIISGVMVASKFFSDIFYTNSRYAKVGGLPVSELNRLELEFLQLNEYNILVSISELQRYGDQLLKVGLMEQEMRILYDASPSTYALRHGRSTSLGSTSLVRTLDGFDGYKQRKSMDQQSVQQLVDGTMKLHLDDHGPCNNNNNINTKRHSVSSFNRYQPQQPYQGTFINKDMCCVYATYPSSLPHSTCSHPPPPPPPPPLQANNKIPSSSNMPRMGSMGSLHSYHQSPTTMATTTTTTEESIITQQQQQMVPPSTTTIASPPLFVRPPSQHNRQQRYSFADWPTTCSSSSFSLSPSTSSVTTCSTSPPKTRQRHESMGSDGNTKVHDTVEWRAPRQTRSSINLYQHNNNDNTIWTNKPVPSVTTPMVSTDSHHQHHPYQQQYQFQYHQQQQQHHHPLHPPPPSSHYQQQPFHLAHYHYPGNNSGGRRSSLTSVHVPVYIPQRPASADYVTTTNGTKPSVSSFGYYPVASTGYGIPTPPPSSSPIHHYHKPDMSYAYLSSSSSSHQLYL